MTSALPAAPVLSELGTVAYVGGLAAFFAGIAVGTLLVFTDRHGYERPVPPEVVGLLLAAGTLMVAAGWIGRHLGP